MCSPVPAGVNGGGPHLQFSALRFTFYIFSGFLLPAASISSSAAHLTLIRLPPSFPSYSAAPLPPPHPSLYWLPL